MDSFKNHLLKLVMKAVRCLLLSDVILCCLLSKRCLLGNNVVLDRAYIWKGITIASNVEIHQSVICDNVVVKEGVTLKEQCVLAFNVRLAYSSLCTCMTEPKEQHTRNVVCFTAWLRWWLGLISHCQRGRWCPCIIQTKRRKRMKMSF